MRENNKSVQTSNGIGFSGLLTVLFIGLKLTNNIDWSWWWVLSPLWITAGLVIFILLIVFIILIITNRRRSHKGLISRMKRINKKLKKKTKTNKSDILKEE
jgi:membrane protein YdbS with pleckstrin-like domain